MQEQEYWNGFIAMLPLAWLNGEEIVYVDHLKSIQVLYKCKRGMNMHVNSVASSLFNTEPNASEDKTVVINRFRLVKLILFIICRGTAQ